MLFRTLSFFSLLVSLLLLSGCDQESPSEKGRVMRPDSAMVDQSQNAEVSRVSEGVKNSVASSSEVMEIDWDALIPDSYRPDTDLLEQYNNGEIEETDPRIIALDKQMQELFDLAPVNSELAGRMVKLPGFVIPIEHEGDKISEFLLVPYHGACIHVPAPPANQIVYVRVPGGTTAASRVYDTVWVTGRLAIEQIDNDVAESGYVMEAAEVEPFE